MIEQIARFGWTNSNTSKIGSLTNNRLEYSVTGNPNFTGYTDADGGRDEDRRSTPGYVFSKMGGAISWNCTQQDVVALSIC